MRDNGKRIIEILKEELKLYDSLESLVNEQERKIEKVDIEGLLKIISKKQVILSEQDKLNEELETMQAGLSSLIESAKDEKASVLNLFPEDIREEIKLLVESIRNKLSNILEVEDRSRKKLSEEVEKVKKALRSVRDGKKLVAGYYGGVGVPEPRFIDQRK